MPFFLIFIAFLASTFYFPAYTIYSKQNSSEVIIWKANKKLSWNDFNAMADSNSEYKAITSTNIKTEVIVFTNELLKYKVYCEFEKKKSWVKVKTTSLLRHEQLHFDIAELAVRRMRETLSRQKSLNTDSINTTINSCFNQAVLDRRFINEKYDEETAHGTITKKQEEWERAITAELRKLKEFSFSIITIRN